MSTIQVQIPDSLQKSLDDLAARDGISIDDFLLDFDKAGEFNR